MTTSKLDGKLDGRLIVGLTVERALAPAGLAVESTVGRELLMGIETFDRLVLDPAERLTKKRLKAVKLT